MPWDPGIPADADWGTACTEMATKHSRARVSSRFLYMPAIVTEREWRARKTGRAVRRLWQRLVGTLGQQNLLGLRKLEYRRERRVGLHLVHGSVALFLGFAQVGQAALEISGFRERFGQEKVEPAAIADRTVLQDRAAAR